MIMMRYELHWEIWRWRIGGLNFGLGFIVLCTLELNEKVGEESEFPYRNA